MKHKTHAIATALGFFKGIFSFNNHWFLGFGAQGFPSLIRYSIFLFLDEKKQKSRLTNLWLKMYSYGAQSGAVAFHSTSSLCFLTIPSHFFHAKSSEAGLMDGSSSLFILGVQGFIKLKAIVLKFNIIYYFPFLKKLWEGYKDRQRYRNEVQRRLFKQRALKRERSLENGHWTDRFLKIVESLGFKVKSLKLNIRVESIKFKVAGMMVIVISVSIGGNVQSQSKALEIGDSLPALTLQKVSNYKSSTLNLADFKGKLVILDFWATWCAPCVTSIPMLDSLQKVYPNQIQIITVTYQSNKEVDKFKEQLLKRGVKTNLVEVVEDKKLHLLFPHNQLPHEVWISPEGKVMAFTRGYEVNVKNIEAALKTQLKVAVKKDVRIPYNIDAPLFINQNGGTGENIQYHRVFSKYVNGLPGKSMSWVKPNGEVHIALTNSDLSHLYQNAFAAGKVELLSRNRLQILVKDSTQFFAPKDPALFHEWAIKHCYCYELFCPPSFKKIAFEEMKQDLRMLFPQYEASVQPVATDCWVLKRTSQLDKMATKGGERQSDNSIIHFELHNSALSQLVGMLDIKYLSLQPYPVLDETGYSGKVDLVLDANMSKVPSINEALKAYDLVLVMEKRKIEMLVVRDAE